ncbi:DUF1206 domain-containing protein [Nakamurella antarctica]|uniref:DUF1206 domain-containing protein n=1 Tax=Nakamurella antarctica TaxID=1902245 RepID=A0A3G8ZUM5_9ACTN|nr:DUF1206 domain-containing protein [Nakamurella antarctica]AZI58194.1 DUF1206 domain-containing protein [Nakamurella antarctica]
MPRLPGAAAAARAGAKQAGRKATEGGRATKDSESFRLLVRVGLISYGVVHILLAWLVAQLAFSGSSGRETSQKGALAELSTSALGLVLLWVVAVGLFALAVWQALEAAIGRFGPVSSRKRTRKRLGAAGKSVAYAGLAVSAVSTAISGDSSSGNGEETLTARLLSAPSGRILVIAVGVGVVVVGGRMIYRGVSKKFTRDLMGGVSERIVRMGQIGFCAKGLILGLIGILFGWAALSYDAQKAGGMDDALRTVREQPYGPGLLMVIATGLLAFGAYCFSWSAHAKH